MYLSPSLLKSMNPSHMNYFKNSFNNLTIRMKNDINYIDRDANVDYDALLTYLRSLVSAASSMSSPPQFTCCVCFEEGNHNKITHGDGKTPHNGDDQRLCTTCFMKILRGNSTCPLCRAQL
jgi:hypothetical protein